MGDTSIFKRPECCIAGLHSKICLLLKWPIYRLRLNYRANLCLKKLAENKIGSPNYKKISLRKTAQFTNHVWKQSSFKCHAKFQNRFHLQAKFVLGWGITNPYVGLLFITDRSVVYMLKIVCLFVCLFVCFFFSLLHDRNGDDACPRRVLSIGLFSYRYGGHIELVRFKEYCGMPRGHKHILIYSLSINVRLSGRKKILLQCLDVMMTAFFPEKYTVLNYYMKNFRNLIGSEYVIFGINTTSDISKLSQISLA